MSTRLPSRRQSSNEFVFPITRNPTNSYYGYCKDQCLPSRAVAAVTGWCDAEKNVDDCCNNPLWSSRVRYGGRDRTEGSFDTARARHHESVLVLALRVERDEVHSARDRFTVFRHFDSWKSLHTSLSQQIPPFFLRSERRLKNGPTAQSDVDGRARASPAGMIHSAQQRLCEQGRMGKTW